MTTGRINQVTGLGPDHDDGATAHVVREPGLPRSCRIAISAATPKGRSRRMPSHTSNATPEKLTRNSPRNAPERTPASAYAASRHVWTVPIRYGYDSRSEDRSANHAEAQFACQRCQVHARDVTQQRSPSVLSTVARNTGSLTQLHRNTHTKLRWAELAKLPQPEDTADAENSESSHRNIGGHSHRPLPTYCATSSPAQKCRPLVYPPDRLSILQSRSMVLGGGPEQKPTPKGFGVGSQAGSLAGSWQAAWRQPGRQLAGSLAAAWQAAGRQPGRRLAGRLAGWQHGCLEVSEKLPIGNQSLKKREEQI